jgi:fructokinase
MENGERDFYFNRGADGMLTNEDVVDINMASFSISHFGSATAFLPGPLQSTYENLLKQAIQYEQFISFDPNYRELLFGNNKEAFIQKSTSFIEQCSFFKVSDEEAFLISGQSSLNDAAAFFTKKSRAIFAITLGKEGTLLGLNGETFIIPSIPIQPIDTTGAGDAFVGAVLYQLSNYSKNEIKAIDIETWKNIFSNANKAGARTCEYMGAMEAFRHLSSDIFHS